MNKRNSTVMRFIKSLASIGAAWVSAFLGPCVWSGPATTVIETIAVSGQSAPGASGREFSSFDSPSLNLNGDIVFRAVLNGAEDSIGTVGLWQKPDGSALEIVTRTGNQVRIDRSPSSPHAPLVAIGTPDLDDQGGVVFKGNLDIGDSSVSQSNDEGLWWSPGSGAGFSALLIAREGDPAEGAGALDYARFGTPVNFRDGAIAFTAELAGAGSDPRYGAWHHPAPQTSGAEDPSLIAISDDFAPGAGNQRFETFQQPSLGSNSHWAFRAFTQPGGDHSDMPLEDDGIWIGSAENLSPLATAGEETPDSSGARFQTLGLPVSNALNQIAFWGGTDSEVNSEGIWLNKFRNVELLALAGERPPGAPPNAVFSQFFDPALNEQGVAAFLGRFNGEDESQNPFSGEGIWLGGAAAYLRLVAQTGVQPPGVPDGFEFAAFGSPIINEIGQVVFTAIVTNGGITGGDVRTGVWATTIDGELQSVVAAGDFMLVPPQSYRLVKDVTMSGFNDLGQIALNLAFTDRSTAIARASLPLPAAADFDDWAGQISAPGSRGGDADPDGDGVPNILEFAFGLDPTRKEEVEFPRVALLRSGRNGDGPAALSIEFPRRLMAGDIQYVVEVSSDLVNWRSGSESVGVVDTEITGDGMETVVVRDLSDPDLTNRCFIRMRVAY